MLILLCIFGYENFSKTTIDLSQYDHIIFSNNGGSQTADLAVTDANNGAVYSNSGSVVQTVAVPSIVLTDKTVAMNAGDTHKVAVKSSTGTLSYASSDKAVATVENGVVTAVSEGTATITVTANGGIESKSATFTVNVASAEKYMVKFVNFDGTVLKTQECSKGEVPVAPAATDCKKPSTDSADYTFAGWDKTIVAVTADTTYTATYKESARMYSITFQKADGTEIAKNDYAYGTTPEAPAVKDYEDDANIYVFAGWDKEIVAVTGDATYTAVFDSNAKMFNVTTRTENGTVTGAPEKAVEYGTTVTLKATADSGYAFNGFYVDGKKVSSNATYTFKVTGNVVVNAIFNELPKSELKVIVVGGSGLEVTMNGKTSSQPMMYDNKNVQTGQYITLKSTGFDGYKFLYWTTLGGTVVSNSETYRFLFSASTTIMAVYANTNVSTVTFISGYNMTHSARSYESADEIEMPTPYSKGGYTFKFWSIDGTTEATPETIFAAAQSGDVTVKAVYEADIVYYDVNLNGGSIATVNNSTEDAGKTSGTYLLNSVVKFTADKAADGKKFAYWQAEDGTIITYAPSYTTYLKGDLNLTAVYVDADATVDVTATANIVSVTYDEKTNKMQAIASLAVPENYTMVYEGLIATSDTTIGSDADAFTYEAAQYQKVQNVEDKNYSVCTYTWTKSNVLLGDTWFLRAYVVYKDAEGNIYTVYGDVVTATRE